MTGGEVNTHLVTKHIFTDFPNFKENPMQVLLKYGKGKAKEPFERDLPNSR